jgi:uncharacterized protein YndB with AHSA1/START domain
MITVSTIVNAPISKVWDYWTSPVHIVKWYHASDDWHAPYAENNLLVGGTFNTTMAAKDGSFKFYLEGTYTKVEPNRIIEFTLADGRDVQVFFTTEDTGIVIVESFEPEDVNSRELQKKGWQSILDNFKKCVEQ